MLTDEQITKAVEFWATFLDKTPTMLEQGMNAELDFKSLLALSVVDQMKSDNPAPVGDVQVFKDTLRDILTQETIRCLSVDYNPDNWLYAALVTAGFNDDALPRKTTCSFDGDKVIAKVGYGAGWREL